MPLECDYQGRVRLKVCSCEYQGWIYIEMKKSIFSKDESGFGQPPLEGLGAQGPGPSHQGSSRYIDKQVP